MKVMYTGPEIAVEVFGTVFPRGMAVDVTDAHALAKLSKHPEFAVDGAPKPEPKKADKPKAET